MPELNRAASADMPAQTRGVATLARKVFAGENLQPLFQELTQAAAQTPPDAGAVLDLGALMQMVGEREDGLAIQSDALSLTRLFRRAHGRGDGLHVLAIVQPGDFMANTPVDFLFEGSNVLFDLLYVDREHGLPANVPPHDVAILAIGESDESADLLAKVRGQLAAWPRPVVNGRVSQILALRRDLASERLAGLPDIVAPLTIRADRAALQRDPPALPIIIRPLGSHAGKGLERIDDSEALVRYLAQTDAGSFYVAPFVDYRDEEGLFRKYRIAFIDRQPFIVHAAISEHWMVHYLNAGMTEDADKRAQEARAMSGFDTGFAARHRRAFADLTERIGLDYFAIDCAETPEGKLLVFEADNAMIIHDMDPPDLFPYKSGPIHRLFDAFHDMLLRRVAMAR